jgi:hypothetical protein
MNVLPHNAPRQLVHVHSAEEGSAGAVEDTTCADTAMTHKMRPKMTSLQNHAPRDAAADERHRAPRGSAAGERHHAPRDAAASTTTNAVMSSDEQHHAGRDVSMLHETWPPMVQVEDKRPAARCSTPASTRALS